MKLEYNKETKVFGIRSSRLSDKVKRFFRSISNKSNLSDYYDEVVLKNEWSHFDESELPKELRNKFKYKAIINLKSYPSLFHLISSLLLDGYGAEKEFITNFGSKNERWLGLYGGKYKELHYGSPFEFPVLYSVPNIETESNPEDFEIYIYK